MTTRLPSARVLTLLGLVLWPAWGGAHSPVDEQIAGVLSQLGHDPANASLYFRLGELHRLRHDWDRALGAFNRAEQLDPGLATVDLRRGVTLYEAGMLAQARPALDRLVAQHPEVGAVWLARARVLAAQGLPDEAAADYARALQLTTPPDPELYVERAQALAPTDPAGAAGGLEGGDQAARAAGPARTARAGIGCAIEAVRRGVAAGRCAGGAFAAPGRMAAPAR